MYMQKSSTPLGVLLGIVMLGSATIATAGAAKGTVSYKHDTATLQRAYLVKGPDAVDEKKIIRRIILSAKDMQAALDSCKVMSCTDSDLGEGMTIELDGGPRINYWVVLKDQRVQYSGTADPATFKTKTDEPGKIAGTFGVDDSASGGPKIDVEFDAALVKEFQSAR
jgi:hypothetical protein